MRTIRLDDFARYGISGATRSGVQVHAYLDIADSLNTMIELEQMTIAQAREVCEDLAVILRDHEPKTEEER